MDIEQFMKEIKEIGITDIKEIPDMLPFYEFINTTKNISIAFQDLTGDKESKIRTLKKEIKEGKTNPWLSEITAWNSAMTLLELQETAQKLTNRERDAAIEALIKVYDFMVRYLAKTSPHKSTKVLSKREEYLKQDLRDMEEEESK